MSEVTLQDVYKAVNDVRLELSGDIRRIENKFDNLEAGRLSRVERDMAEMKASYSPVRLVVFAAVGLILTTVVGALVSNLIISVHPTTTVQVDQ